MWKMKAANLRRLWNIGPTDENIKNGDTRICRMSKSGFIGGLGGGARMWLQYRINSKILQEF